MNENTLKNIQASKKAADIFWLYEDILPSVLNELGIDFSYAELLEAIYQTEATGDTEHRAEILKENLEAKTLLHGTKAAVTAWILFIAEFYRESKEISREEVQETFKRYGIYDFLSSNYPPFHTASEKLVVRHIDEYIESKHL